MRNLCSEDLWVVGGDFNIITSLAEKKGGMRIMDADMETFGDIISKSHLGTSQQLMEYILGIIDEEGPSNCFTTGYVPNLIISHKQRYIHGSLDPPRYGIKPLVDKIGSGSESDP